MTKRQAITDIGTNWISHCEYIFFFFYIDCLLALVSSMFDSKRKVNLFTEARLIEANKKIYDKKGTEIFIY